MEKLLNFLKYFIHFIIFMSNSLSKISISLILRSIRKDNDCISHIRTKMLEIIDSLSYFKVLNLDSNRVDFISSLIFFFTNYKLQKNKHSW